MRRLAISIFVLIACHQVWFPIKSDETISGKQSGRAHVHIFQGKVLQYLSQLKGNGARRRFYFRELYFWHDTFSGSANTGAGSGVNSSRAAQTAPKAHEGNTLINLSKESTGIALSAADLETITAHGILRSPCHIKWTEHQYKCCDWEEGRDEGRAKPASTEDSEWGKQKRKSTFSVIQQMESIVGLEIRAWLGPLPPRQICTVNVLFMKHIARHGLQQYMNLHWYRSKRVYYCNTC